MKLSIFGTGYVGLVTGACLADVGHDVICVDIDQSKIDSLKQGGIPIYEPGLESVVKSNIAQGNLRFTTSAEEAVQHAEVIFIAVGTPPDEDGSADLQYVMAVGETIGQLMSNYKVIVNKSTVPVGTADKVTAVIQQALKERNSVAEFDVVSNPEFLKEGAALADFMRPDRIVIGTSSDSAESIMREVYAPFNRNHEKIIVMDVRSSELSKYAANCMLATKISFMNEMANIAGLVGADIENVRKGIGSDPRIGYHFIYAGCGYGGSCFPKDVQALAQTAKQYGYVPGILDAVEAVNTKQKEKLFELICKHYEVETTTGKGNVTDSLKGKTFALWGLAFKANTDDMREAPSRVLMEQLWAAGAKVQAYDPEAMEEAQRIYGSTDKLALTGTKESALKGADALVICTEWKSFKTLNAEILASNMKDMVVFDGRNLFNLAKMLEQGVKYYSIGRPSIC
ncbi:UDP-glucose/GDP-mannose dehydrogenase family protein [Rheinheimera sp. 1928-s]|uniref:UDP-glucose dehydrogenase family protein n=1 Tax=Rheinheimera sp. 1928-s TaxID=3033803 RepID=UPI0026131AF5|nr:UDP-glucose/GDP-mannose dehydrogenase family protein [Rheinheimera sp. 1928-s]MDF3125686.1 UDP-glucose/GDP-mannose dehydrogenase family protein [Rheinheimera sp. 1928-s]